MIAKEEYVKVGTVVRHKNFTPRYMVCSTKVGYKSVFGYKRCVALRPIDHECGYDTIAIEIDEFMSDYKIAKDEYGIC